MEFEHRWQCAVTEEVLRHGGLEEKAFRLIGPDHWALRPQVLTQGYSSTVAKIVGLLVHLYFEMEGTSGKVDIPQPLPAGLSYSSQLIRQGAPAAAELFLWLDGRPQRALRALLDPETCKD